MSFNIGIVAEGLIKGQRFTRLSWAGSLHSWVGLHKEAGVFYREGEPLEYAPYIAIVTNGIIAPWVITPDDFLATDWVVYTEPAKG